MHKVLKQLNLPTEQASLCDEKGDIDKYLPGYVLVNLHGRTFLVFWKTWGHRLATAVDVFYLATCLRSSSGSNHIICLLFFSHLNTLIFMRLFNEWNIEKWVELQSGI